MKTFAWALLVMAAVTGATVHADDAALYNVLHAQTITEGTAAVPRNLDNAQLTLVLRQPAEKNLDITVGLSRRDGKWTPRGSAGTIRLSPPIQTGSGPPVGPQRGSCTPGDDLKVTDNGLSGKLMVRLDTLKAGSKSIYFSATCQVTIDLKRTGKPAVASDPDPSTPPWRKNNARPAGWEYVGTYSATIDGDSPLGAKIEGEAVAGIAVSASDATERAPAHWGTTGSAVIEPAPDGAKVTLSLGTKRISAGAAQGAVQLPLRTFTPPTVTAVEATTLPRAGTLHPLNLSNFDGLRITVASDQRRDDVALNVSLQEARGAWYTCEGGALLLGKEAQFIVPFADMKHAGGFDDKVWLDPRALRTLSIGAADGRGVGDIVFTIKKIEAVRWKSAPDPVLPVELKVAPVLLAHEGSALVPKGLFGFHDVRRPRDPAEPQKLLAYARQLNPGFLRDIQHTGFGGRPISDEEIKARQAQRVVDAGNTRPENLKFSQQRTIAAGAGDAFMLTHTENLWARPSWMNAMATGQMDAYLQGVENMYRGIGRDAYVAGDTYNALRLLEVTNEPFMWGRHMNKRDPRFIDPTQHSDQPGDLVTNVYCQIFKAAAKGFKAVNKDSKIGGPCTADFNGDHYLNVRQFVGKFVEQCHDQIDFLTEHHYQGSPASFAAGYEVMTAYADTRVGKRFPIYNTEANDLIDTPNKGEKKEDQPWNPNIDQLNRAYYNAMDIVTMIKMLPDIAKGRAMHALWDGYCRNEGETAVYTLMNNLRGDVLVCESSDPGVVALATRNGQNVVVLAINDTPHPRAINLSVPKGASGAFQLETLVFDHNLGTRIGATKGQRVEAGVVRADVPPRCLAKWTLPATLETTTQDQRRFYAKAVLQDVRPDKPLPALYKLPADLLAKATGAYLRVVTHDVQRGEGAVRIGASQVTLPPSRSSGAIIQEIPIKVADLSPAGELVFSVLKPDVHNGYEVASAAIVLVVPGK